MVLLLCLAPGVATLYRDLGALFLRPSRFDDRAGSHHKPFTIRGTYNLPVPLKTRRWNDPIETDDGLRILITRFRPRGISKQEETWHEWRPHLGPSAALLKSFKGRESSPIGWASYRKHYLAEMKQQQQEIDSLAAKLRAGENITLLCSYSCDREARCHRSLLRELIEQSLPT